MGNLDGGATLVYPVPRTEEADWELYEGTVPQSVPHMTAIDLLRAVLANWASSRDALVVHDLAVRWNPKKPRIGVNPDVSVLMPTPPDAQRLTSLRTWQPGHFPPPLGIEIVSAGHPHKDYAIVPEKYAASGVKELCVFDPLLCGPKNFNGPFLLQMWRLDDAGNFRRIYQGKGPVRSDFLGAWLVAVDDGRKLRVSNDEAGTDLWLTAEEAALAEKEAALARVAELEAELARRR